MIKKYEIQESVKVPIRIIGIEDKGKYFILKFGDFSTGHFLFCETRDTKKENKIDYYNYLKNKVKDYAWRVTFFCPNYVCKRITWDDIEKDKALTNHFGELKPYIPDLGWPEMLQTVVLYGGIGLNTPSILINKLQKDYVDSEEIGQKSLPTHNPYAEKIETMRKRLEFIFPNYQIEALNKHQYSYYDFSDFSDFCKKNKSMIETCFYFGEYCKKNRTWLSDYNKWKPYRINGKLIKEMSMLLKSLVFEAQVANPHRDNSVLEQINIQIEEIVNGERPNSLKKASNEGIFLTYSFMAGLIAITDKEIDDFWELQYQKQRKEDEELDEFFTGIDNIDEECYSQTTKTPEDTIMDALENGHGDNFGF